MRKYLLFAYISIIIAFALPLNPVKPTGDGIEAVKPTSLIEPLRALETQQVDALAYKQEKPAPVPPPVPVARPSGSHNEWMAAAGIPQDQWSAAETLVQRESSWNPLAMNNIGACSLVQALPCSKIPGDWRDPVTALRWGHGYVVSRYGTWNSALAHSYNNNWY